MKPIIAIPQMGNSLFRKYMKSKYAQSLERAGASVKWIELDSPKQAAEEALACDGLLLPGGADINPSLYHETPDAHCGKPNVIRDAAEPVILEQFLQTGKPILAICRGCQLVNVYFGGTLIQDIKDTQTFRHMDFLARAKSTHPVSIAPDSILSGLLDSDSVNVNSMHHQAVGKVGNGLRVTAQSPDGFVEGLELEGHPFCVCVQWHPEHMSKRDEKQQKLFDAFVGMN